MLFATTWANAYDRLWRSAKIARGCVTAQSGWTGKPSEAPPGAVIAGCPAPRLTNAEAVRLIRAYKAAIVGTSASWSLWYQFAAIAYGWDPPEVDELDASSVRADASYVPDVCVALWMALFDLTKQLDRGGSPAQLTLDGDFAEASWLADVRGHLRGDGAEATFKIPTPFCRDKKTGKNRTPYPPCDTKDPLTGRPWLKCDSPGDCEPVMVDDPLTTLLNKLLPYALMAGALWLMTRDKPRRVRRYRDN